MARCKSMQAAEDLNELAATVAAEHPGHVLLVFVPGSDAVEIPDAVAVLSKDLTMSHVIHVARSRVQGLKPSEGLYLFVNKRLFAGAAVLGEVHAKDADGDGILRVTVAVENTFGGIAASACSRDDGSETDPRFDPPLQYTPLNPPEQPEIQREQPAPKLLTRSQSSNLETVVRARHKSRAPQRMGQSESHDLKVAELMASAGLAPADHEEEPVIVPPPPAIGPDIKGAITVDAFMKSGVVPAALTKADVAQIVAQCDGDPDRAVVQMEREAATRESLERYEKELLESDGDRLVDEYVRLDREIAPLPAVPSADAQVMHELCDLVPAKIASMDELRAVYTALRRFSSARHQDIEQPLKRLLLKYCLLTATLKFRATDPDAPVCDNLARARVYGGMFGDSRPSNPEELVRATERASERVAFLAEFVQGVQATQEMRTRLTLLLGWAPSFPESLKISFPRVRADGSSHSSGSVPSLVTMAPASPRQEEEKENEPRLFEVGDHSPFMNSREIDTSTTIAHALLTEVPEDGIVTSITGLVVKGMELAEGLYLRRAQGVNKRRVVAYAVIDVAAFFGLEVSFDQAAAVIDLLFAVAKGKALRLDKGKNGFAALFASCVGIK